MENNDSPYLYEKPLRTNSSKRNKGFVALGLVALGTAIGGGAFANVLVADAVKSTQMGGDSGVLIAGDATSQMAPNSISDSLAQAASIGVTPIVSVPLEQAEPNEATAAVTLPDLPVVDYGNTSSATPSAGGGQTGSNTSSSKSFADSVDDREDHDYEDDERDDDDDDDDDENEED